MAQGKTFLKVTGILMIIGGAISTIVALIAIFGSAVINEVGAELGEAEAEIVSELGSNVATAIGSVLMTASIIWLVSAVLELVAGIIGCANANKPEKAVLCMVFGIIVAVIAIVSIVMSIINGAGIVDVIVSIICSLVIPVLYIIGAIKNKESVK